VSTQLITLKHLTVHRSLMRQSYCYEATVYYDGSRACYVTNSGNGEPDVITDIQPCYGAMLAYVATLGSVQVDRAGNHYSYQPTLETVCHGLVADQIALQDVKRLMKSRILIVRDGNVYQSPKLDKQADKLIHIKNYQLSEPDSIILNSLPLSEAYEIYRGLV